jgi:phage gp29-like protein
MAKSARKKTGAAPRVEKGKPRAPKGQVTTDLSLWNSATRIGGGITPQKISQIIRAADTGSIYQLLDLANECRQRDPHLHAVLATNEESIAGLQWDIKPAEDARAKDKRAAKWVESVLRETDGLHNLIAHLAGAIYYSFSVSEIVWTKRDGKLVPDRFAHLAHRRFAFRRENGKLAYTDIPGALPVATDLQDAFPNKFIFSQPRVTGDVPSREGLCRSLVWISVMRNWDIADWLKSGELTWKPWRTGTYKKTGSSAEDREDLETVMRRMTTDFTAVIPDTTSIKVEWPGGRAGAGSPHAELCRVLSAEMSKAVLGQTETTESSKSSGYAQAAVHDAVRRDLRESRAMQVAADLTRDLIEPMIRLNFGDTVKLPRFEFNTDEDADLTAFSLALVNLRKSGVRIPEAWVYDEAGIPPPKDGEPVLSGGDPIQGDQGANGSGTPDQGEPQANPSADQPSTAEPAPTEEPSVAEE